MEFHATSFRTRPRPGEQPAALSNDFTQGSIPRKLVVFALPILVANLLQGSMQLVNVLWVGNLLGSRALAAVTVAHAVLMLVLAFVLGLNNATLTIFAQLRGSGDASRTDAYLGAFAILLLGRSAVVGVARWFASRCRLALLFIPPQVVHPARAFLRISFACTVFLVGYTIIGTLLLAFGNIRTPLYFVVHATVLAGVLAPLLIE